MYTTRSYKNESKVSPRISFFAALLIIITAVLLFSPRVVSMTPGSESIQVPAFAPISLTFSTTMDQVSVEARLKIDPLPAGEINWDGKTMTFQPAEAWEPGTVVTVQLGSGVRSRSLIPLLRSYEWVFTVGSPRLVYLWPEGGAANIYSRTIDGSQTMQLTDHENGISDFSLGPGRTSLIYSAYSTEGESVIRYLDLANGRNTVLYTCPEGFVCRQAVISSQGNMLAFERIQLEEDGRGLIFDSKQVWALRLEEGLQAYPIGPLGHQTSLPSWSSAGLLGYYNHTLNAVVVADPDFGSVPPALELIPSALVVSAVWSADKDAFIIPRVEFEEDSFDLIAGERIAVFNSHLMRFELYSVRGGTDLSGAGSGRVEDSAPVYSPDGNWICFTRKYLEPDRWTPGRQLWLMSADGSETFQLLNEPDYNHVNAAWSPDSTALVYIRGNQADLSEDIEIWLYDLGDQSTTQLVTRGFAPQWIP